MAHRETPAEEAKTTEADDLMAWFGRLGSRNWWEAIGVEGPKHG